MTKIPEKADAGAGGMGGGMVGGMGGRLGPHDVNTVPSRLFSK